MTKAVGD